MTRRPAADAGAHAGGLGPVQPGQPPLRRLLLPRRRAGSGSDRDAACPRAGPAAGPEERPSRQRGGGALRSPAAAGGCGAQRVRGSRPEGGLGLTALQRVRGSRQGGGLGGPPVSRRLAARPFVLGRRRFPREARSPCHGRPCGTAALLPGALLPLLPERVAASAASAGSAAAASAGKGGRLAGAGRCMAVRLLWSLAPHFPSGTRFSPAPCRPLSSG